MGIVSPSTQVKTLKSGEVLWLIQDQTTHKRRTRSHTKVSQTLRSRFPMSILCREPFAEPHSQASALSSKRALEIDRNQAEQWWLYFLKDPEGGSLRGKSAYHDHSQRIEAQPILRHCFLKEHLWGLRKEEHCYLSIHLHHEVNFSAILLNTTGLGNY